MVIIANAVARCLVTSQPNTKPKNSPPKPTGQRHQFGRQPNRAGLDEKHDMRGAVGAHAEQQPRAPNDSRPA